ncbi:hypothetical protein C8Q80DRAFT_1315335, partial [Daedaleopsis nitida]
LASGNSGCAVCVGRPPLRPSSPSSAISRTCGCSRWSSRSQDTWTRARYGPPSSRGANGLSPGSRGIDIRTSPLDSSPARAARVAPPLRADMHRHLWEAQDEVGVPSLRCLNFAAGAPQCQTPDLRALEVEYGVDDAEADLLSEIVGRFPRLTMLELHRLPKELYAEVPVESIARALSPLAQLRILRLNFALPGEPRPHLVIDRETYRPGPGRFAAFYKVWDVCRLSPTRCPGRSTSSGLCISRSRSLPGTNLQR